MCEKLLWLGLVCGVGTKQAPEAPGKKANDKLCSLDGFFML